MEEFRKVDISPINDLSDELTLTLHSITQVQRDENRASWA